MKKYISEFIGTFALVFFGTGAIISHEISEGIVSHAGIAITFGLIVMVMIYSLGDISGAHINPAVSFAFWTQKQLAGKEFIKYTLSQTLGAITASGVLKFLFPQSQKLVSTLPAGSGQQSFVLEVILMFLLMFVITRAASGAKEKGIITATIIGAVVLLEALFAGPISGASMNPARSLAPALVSGNFEYLWIYLTAPFLGSYLGTVCARIVK